MRFANPHPPRRGAFLLIALFSCLQILCGFFLFTENGHDSALPIKRSLHIATYEPKTTPEALNAIKPASGINTAGYKLINYSSATKNHRSVKIIPENSE